jgi:hypothetical protein
LSNKRKLNLKSHLTWYTPEGKLALHRKPIRIAGPFSAPSLSFLPLFKSVEPLGVRLNCERDRPSHPSPFSLSFLELDGWIELVLESVLVTFKEHTG